MKGRKKDCYDHMGVGRNVQGYQSKKASLRREILLLVFDFPCQSPLLKLNCTNTSYTSKTIPSTSSATSITNTIYLLLINIKLGFRKKDSLKFSSKRVSNQLRNATDVSTLYTCLTYKLVVNQEQIKLNYNLKEQNSLEN